MTGTTGVFQVKVISEAMKKIFSYRDDVNSGRTKIVADDFSSVVYLYENRAGEPCAVGYKGRAKKPAFCYRFKDVNKRADSIANWMRSNLNKSTKHRRERKPRAIGVGDVLVSVWGYDQTNVDYYMVAELVGKSSVEIVKIGSKSSIKNRQDDFIDHHEGLVVPDKSKIVSSPMRKLVDGVQVRISCYETATKQEPVNNSAGDLYRPKHYTSYC